VEVPVMLRFIFALIATAFLANAAAADSSSLTPTGDDAGVQRLTRLMDLNRDGVISRKEFVRHNADRAGWRKLDVNGDGMLDAVEQTAGVRPGPRIVR
jgi:EF hand